jgi:hypothetical protein
MDSLCNEMFKSVQSFIVKCLHKLYSAVLLSGYYPKKWCESFIVPILKSDNPRLPQNYRDIAVSNCFGRILNIILNNRLDSFLLENNLIHESHIGFSKKARTSDHLFVLKCLINKYINGDHKKLYVCFVDFKKAFDTVIHSGIKYRLLQNNINGMFYRILCDMYKKNYLSVKLGSKLTQPFKSDVGVRQGVVLTPIFSKFFLMI